MTLIITALADDAVVQVSDRRLTAGGVPLPSPENKAICVSGADASFAVAYTGRARIGNTGMAVWLVDHFHQMAAPRRTLPQIVEALQQAATTELSRKPIQALTIVLAGFGAVGPFAVLVSNAEDASGWFPSPKHDFVSHAFFRNKKRMRKLDLMINGREDAVESTIGGMIPKVRRHFLKRTGSERARVLVELVRLVAEHPKVGHFIGKDCVSVIVPPSGDFASQYHPKCAEPIAFAPNVVSSVGSFADVSYSLPPGWSMKLGG